MPFINYMRWVSVKYVVVGRWSGQISNISMKREKFHKIAETEQELNNWESMMCVCVCGGGGN